MSENETHAEIVKRMQNFARQNKSWPCSEDIKAFAVKLDAANRREVAAGKQERPGNAAKMREALLEIVLLCRKVGLSIHGDVACGIIASKARAALAEPARNCDVGTVQEQRSRFDNFCKKGKLGSIDLGAYCADDCPCGMSFDCKLEWAQMPYEESKEGKETRGDGSPRAEQISGNGAGEEKEETR